MPPATIYIVEDRFLSIQLYKNTLQYIHTLLLLIILTYTRLP